MKTREFIQKVEELGYETSLDGRNIDILTRADIPFCSVCRTETMQMSQTYYDEDFWNLITPNKKEELFNLMVEYARTPLEEREVEE